MIEILPPIIGTSLISFKFFDVTVNLRQKASVYFASYAKGSSTLNEIFMYVANPGDPME